jgi:hypothetical protein
MNRKHAETAIEQIKTELQTLGAMRPGSLGRQYSKCGRAGCRCQDPEAPERHGPYYQLSYVHRGKSTSQFIPKELVDTAKEQLATYKRFKALTSRWLDLALALARDQLDRDRKRLKDSRSDEPID